MVKECIKCGADRQKLVLLAPHGEYKCQECGHVFTEWDLISLEMEVSDG